MKKTFHLKSKTKNNKIFFTILFVIAVIILVNFTLPQIIPGELNNIGKPFWKFRELVVENFNDLRNMLSSKSFLVTENKRLQNELEKKQREVMKINILEKENEELKQLLGREDEGRRVLSRVLSGNSQSVHDTLIIDIGNKKISEGSRVFFESSTLVGLVDEVYRKTARVKLLSAPGNKHSIEIGEEAIPGTAEGLGGGDFEVKLPRGADIKIGDEIISPDLSIILLGVVEHIESEAQNSFQRILFKSPVNISQIKWVEIETE